MDASCDLIELTVSLVASFVSYNAVTAAELPGLIRSTYTTLSELTASHTGSQIPRIPAVPRLTRPDGIGRPGRSRASCLPLVWS